MNSHRIWGIALGLSLSLNVFCLSALLTDWLAPADGPQAEARGPVPAHARALFNSMALHRQPGFQQARKEIHKQRQRVRTALLAEPFDADRLAKALAELRAAESSTAQLAHRRITEVAATLPAEERQMLERFIGRSPGQGPRPHRPPGPRH